MGMSFRNEVKQYRGEKAKRGGFYVFMPMYFEGVSPSFEVPVPVEIDSVTVSGAEGDTVQLVDSEGGVVMEFVLEGGRATARGLKVGPGSEFTFKSGRKKISITAVMRVPVVRIG